MCSPHCHSCIQAEICETCPGAQLLVDVVHSPQHGKCVDACGQDQVPDYETNLVQARCVLRAERCGVGYYLNSIGKCDQCDVACVSCHGPGSFGCDSCAVGYGNRSTGYCKPCCQANQSPENYRCEDCSSTTKYPLHRSTGLFWSSIWVVMLVVIVVSLFGFIAYCFFGDDRNQVDYTPLPHYSTQTGEVNILGCDSDEDDAFLCIAILLRFYSMSSTETFHTTRHRTLKTYDWALKASVSCSESIANLRPIVRIVLHFEEGDIEVAEFTEEQALHLIHQYVDGKDYHHLVVKSASWGLFPRFGLSRREYPELFWGIINRYEYNDGVGRVQQRVKDARVNWQDDFAIFGVNIGQNKENEDPKLDFEIGVNYFAPYCDYIVLNVYPSDPTKPTMKNHELQKLLLYIKHLIDVMNLAPRPKVFLKIDPDTTHKERKDIAKVLPVFWVENFCYFYKPSQFCLLKDWTFVECYSFIQIKRLKSENKTEIGGLSGAPLREISTKCIHDMYKLTAGQVPIIGCGGISSGAHVYEKIRAGASVVQLYSAIVFHGFPIVGKVRLCNT
ncbi:dihydroorotate oxidase [Dictyocaulus viviparus]|uniref:Dihydroorotate oxidase n=1 Tax=Dictyocaulus viviparus TaxID=29172 RepID=A0A0D8Y2N3_DICVI|nr:dihydroorotate oxidase [Dictyocaulus viviparus]